MTINRNSFLYRDKTALPDKGEEGVKVCLEAVELTPDHHAIFRTVAVAVLNNHMYVDTGPLFIRT